MKNFNMLSVVAWLALGLMSMGVVAMEPALEGGSATGEYAVTGVDRGDVLNIRARPGVAATIVGGIPADGSGIRLLGPVERHKGSTWREIEYQGMRGWVNARFLTVGSAASNKETLGLDAELHCLGTEPFWRIGIEGSRMEVDQMGDKTLFTATTPQISANHTNVWAIAFENPTRGERGMAFLELTNRCSDDMSDYLYKYTFRVGFEGGVVLSGCCNRLP